MTIPGENRYLYHSSQASTLLVLELISHLGVPTDHLVLLYLIPLLAWVELALLFLKCLKEEGLTHPTYLYRLPIFMDRIHGFLLNPFDRRGRSFNVSCFWRRRSLRMAGLATSPFATQLGRSDNRVCSWALSPEMAGIAIAGALIQPFVSIDQSLR